MAAVINTTPDRRSGTAAGRSGVVAGPSSTRPTLRVVAGGRAAGDPITSGARPATDRSGRPTPTSAPRRHAPSVYWRRRMVVGFVAVFGLTVVWLAAVGAAAVASGGPESTSGAADAVAADAVVDGSSPAGPVYVVQPGDTLWSIAASLDLDGDIRAVVGELADRTGGAALQPGQRIRLDGLAS